MNNDKRKALGRGLDSLLPASRPSAPAPAAPAVPAGEAVLQLAIDSIERNPYQTRTHVDETALNELAASIKASGVLQPVVVRHVPGPNGKDGKYQLIAGERRWLASQRAGRQTVPAIVKQVSNEQAMEMTIIENLQREDLNPIEQALAFERLGREFGLTQEQMAQKTGKDRSSVSNYLRLLKMPPDIQTGLSNNKLTFWHAKALMMLDSQEQMLWAATRVVKDGLSVRQTEDLVHKVLEPADTPREPKLKPKDPNVREAEQQLQRSLGVKVRIQDRNGRGKIVIEYANLEDFDRVIDALS